MKKIISVMLCAALALLALSACDSNRISTAEPNGEADGVYSKGTHHVEIDIKDYGVIKLELYADIAPISVSNFCALANDGFYNGLTFHRIINGFMMQGGAGSGAKTIKGEFESNGVKNDLEHTRGVISMARADAYDSASSQFFIVHQDSPHLNGDYAAFGKVTDGMDIVDEICTTTPVTDLNGTVTSNNQPIINSIKVID